MQSLSQTSFKVLRSGRINHASFQPQQDNKSILRFHRIFQLISPSHPLLLIDSSAMVGHVPPLAPQPHNKLHCPFGIGYCYEVF